MVQSLIALAKRMESIDLDGCSSEDLKSLSTATITGVSVLEGFLVQIATAAKKLEEAGAGSTAVDVIRSGGAVSKRRSEQIGRRAEVGQLLPTLGSELSLGASSVENADTIAKRSVPLSASELDRLASQDHEISERARNLPPEAFDRYFSDVIRRIRDDHDDQLSIAERQRAASEFTMTRRIDGMWQLRGLLDEERGATLNDLVSAKARDLADLDRAADFSPIHTFSNAQAAALHSLATTSGTNGVPARMNVGYIVDAKTLSVGPHEDSVAQTWAGDDIDPASLARLACDADCYAILVDELGEPGPVGRTRRSATRAQRLALRALYAECPLDGTPFDGCEIHHVNVPWEAGGETELDNLLPLSTHWHHLVHDRGWTLKMATDRSLKLWRPDGTLERAIPPPDPLTRPSRRAPSG